MAIKTAADAPAPDGDPGSTDRRRLVLILGALMLGMLLAALCRAAENTCYFAMVNCASAGSGTTSAVVRPDGTVQCWQPYGEEGLLVADVELEAATGLLAKRLKVSGE